jgi:hypothetical protein
MTTTPAPADPIELPALPPLGLRFWLSPRRWAREFAVSAVMKDRVRPGAPGGVWIDINDREPLQEKRYWTYSPLSEYKHNAHMWLPSARAWEHEWLAKKRLQARPRTWITHWQELTCPTGAPA